MTVRSCHDACKGWARYVPDPNPFLHDYGEDKIAERTANRCDIHRQPFCKIPLRWQTVSHFEAGM
ncbi:MAG: hypothetical protein V8T87_03640 [Victivallales bacterium]